MQIHQKLPEITLLVDKGVAVKPESSNEPSRRNAYVSLLHNETDADLAAIASIPEIVRIDLSKCRQITDAGIAKLANIATLASLQLQDCDKLTDRSAQVFATLNLEKLRLTGTHIHPGALRFRYPEKMEDLMLNRTDASDADVRALQPMPRLASLGLHKCDRLTDEAIYSIVRKFPNLERLDISGDSGITIHGIMRLKELKRLAYLHLKETGLSTDDLKRVQSEFPNVHFL